MRQNEIEALVQLEWTLFQQTQNEGGRDVRVESIQHVFADLEKIAETGDVDETYRYLDVRE